MKLEEQFKKSLKVEVPDGAQQHVRDRVMATAIEKAEQRRKARRPLLRLPANPWGMVRLNPLVLATIVFLGLFAGTGLAAGRAEPDSWLYGVKQTAEGIRVNLAGGSLDKALAELARAENRLSEMAVMLEEEKLEYVGDLARRYDDHVQSALALRQEAQGEGDSVTEIDERLASLSSRYSSLIERYRLDSPLDASLDGVTYRTHDGFVSVVASEASGSRLKNASSGNSSALTTPAGQGYYSSQIYAATTGGSHAAPAAPGRNDPPARNDPPGNGPPPGHSPTSDANQAPGSGQLPGQNSSPNNSGEPNRSGLEGGNSNGNSANGSLARNSSESQGSAASSRSHAFPAAKIRP